MPRNFTSYKDIFKTTTIFGGVQVLQVLTNIAKIKFVAILLGPSGMGIYTLFQSALATIIQFSNLGVFQSAVREIAIVKELGDDIKTARFIKNFKILAIIIGVFGAIIFLCLSPFLSSVSFGNQKYTISFAILSISLFFYTFANYYISVLQGLRELSVLAKASLASAVTNLLISVTLFYYYGIIGIVPSFILGYLSILIMNYYFSRDLKLKSSYTPRLFEIIEVSKPIIKLGIILMAGNLLMTIFKFATNAYIRVLGNIEDVGFFQAAFTISYGNIIIIMQVMAADYYPRLSAVAKNKLKVFKIVNEQIELVILLITPITVIIIIFAPLIVKVLLSSKFLIIVPLLRLMAVSLLLKSVWHALSYLILSKGDKKTYFIYDALIGNGFNFVVGLVSYKLWGLNGLGISFLVGSIVMVTILSLVSFQKYKFRFSMKFIRTISILMILCILSYIFSILSDFFLRDFFLLIILISTIITSFVLLNKRIDFVNILKVRFTKKLRT